MTTESNLNRLSEEIDKFYTLLDKMADIDLDNFEVFSIVKGEKKLNKKERRKLAEDTFKAKLPTVFRQLEEFSLVIEGLSDKVEGMKTELQEKADEVEDLENDKEELQSRIDDLQ